MIVRPFSPDHNCEETWEHFIRGHLRLCDQVGKRQVTLYAKNNKIKTYSYGNVTHQALPWPAEPTAIAQALNIPEEHDHCLFQVFQQGAGINFHADDEPLIQPDSIITTVSIGHCELLTKSNATSETHKQILTGPVVYTMPQGFQKTHKHSVRSLQNGRLSITFRTSVHANQEDMLPWHKWLPILNAAGFKGNQRQVNPNDGALIFPISDIKKLPTVKAGDPGLLATMEKLHRALLS